MAGLIVALAGEPNVARAGSQARDRGLESQAALRRNRALFLSCMVLAALPDIDWVYPYLHRGPTHSLGATVIVLLLVAAVTRWWSGRTHWRTVGACGLAYFSHIVMDWLGQDLTMSPGVMALWPFSDQRMLSGWTLFRSTWRLDPLAPANIVNNAKALAQEMVILAPILLLALWRRTRHPLSGK